MDEILNTAESTALPETVPEIYFGTVDSWTMADGVSITLDGQSDAMTKTYKQLLVSRPLPIGARVAVMKISGSYVVLGEIATPIGLQRPADLASGASLADVISKVNAILGGLRTQGVFWPPQS